MRKRLPYLVALVLSGLLLQQSLQLDDWGLLGPGPGLFPRIVTSLCVAAAALLGVFPGLAGDATPDGGDEAPAGWAERRVFLFHCAALILLVPATEYLGFVATALMLALVLTWKAEGRGLATALVLGFGCGLAGVIVFQQLLGAEIPAYAVERAISRLFS